MPRIGFPSGMIFPEILSEKLVHQHIRIVFVDLDLFQDDASLTLDVIGREYRVQNQIGENIQSDRHVVCQRFHIEADGFLTRKRVEIAPNRVHLPRNHLCRPRTRPLEHHVFHKMGNAVGFGCLSARARLDPHPHRYGAQMIHALGQNNQAVGQYSAAEVAFDRHRLLFDSIPGQAGSFVLCCSVVGVKQEPVQQMKGRSGWGKGIGLRLGWRRARKGCIRVGKYSMLAKAVTEKATQLVPLDSTRGAQVIHRALFGLDLRPLQP